MDKPEKKNRYFVTFLAKIAVFALAAYLILTFVIAFHRVGDNNMFPSIRDGDLCILYRLDKYHMGDVVYYRRGGEKSLGRIVATQGQEIDFPEEGGYLLNGFAPSEDILYQTFCPKTTNETYPIVVKDGCFYILNDFRSNTKDSREYGEIKEAEIIGKVIYVLRRRGF